MYQFSKPNTDITNLLLPMVRWMPEMAVVAKPKGKTFPK